MGIFNREFAAAHKTKKRINALKKELAALTNNQQGYSLALEGGKIIQTIRSKGHEAFDNLSDQMQDVSTKAKKNPALTIALVAGLSALTAVLIGVKKRI